eukprot:TRINITY_DN3822_c0_g1_i1.p1 TRINITY_DN3822_c0_g1~~TRINITY_DN3822_c0_g1_i1.p1  ORF type:complete len:691 (-),score=169.92 TRINITY_DN3822_c0_g1_i1:142-2214(-)
MPPPPPPQSRARGDGSRSQRQDARGTAGSKPRQHQERSGSARGTKKSPGTTTPAPAAVAAAVLAREGGFDGDSARRKKKSMSSGGAGAPESKASIGDLAAAPGGPLAPRRRGCMRHLRRAVVALLMFVTYAALLVYLFVLLRDAQRLEAPSGGDSEACKRVLCTEGQHCVLESPDVRPRCLPISSGNVEVLELALGILLGVPSFLCVPCALSWMCRTFSPHLRERLRRRRIRAAKRGQQAAAKAYRPGSDGDEAAGDLEEGELLPEEGEIREEAEEEEEEEETRDPAAEEDICDRLYDCLVRLRAALAAPSTSRAPAPPTSNDVAANPQAEAPPHRSAATASWLPRFLGRADSGAGAPGDAGPGTAAAAAAAEAPSVGAAAPAAAPIAAKADAGDAAAAAGPEDEKDEEDLDDLFAPIRRPSKTAPTRDEGSRAAMPGVEAAEDNDKDEDEEDMSFFFAPRKSKPPGAATMREREPAVPENVEEEDDVDDFDALFAKAGDRGSTKARVSRAAPAPPVEIDHQSAGVEELFYRPSPATAAATAARRLDRERPSPAMFATGGAGAESSYAGTNAGRTDVSAGLSALFAAVGGAGGGVARSRTGRSNAAESSRAASESCFGSEDEAAISEIADAASCDFFGFALRVARLGEDAGLDDVVGEGATPFAGLDSDADSLPGDLVPSTLDELFHAAL